MEVVGAIVMAVIVASAAVGVAGPIESHGTIPTLSGAVTYDAADEDGDGIPETLLLTYGQPPVGFSVHVKPGTEVSIGGILVIIGTSGDDTYDERGGTLPMLAFLGKGNDWFAGGSLGDHVYAGPGADTVSGGEGDDELHGGPGNDDLDGDGGNDLLLGGGDDDDLDGGPDFDHLEGQSGKDTEKNGE